MISRLVSLNAFFKVEQVLAEGRGSYSNSPICTTPRVSICALGRVFRSAMGDERNLRVDGGYTERGLHNYSATICVLRLYGTEKFMICSSDASCRAWFRMGWILTPSKPSRSTISACCPLSETLLCLYTSPRFHECRNARTPNCVGECPRSKGSRILRG
jgi:hypothetical protein